MTDLKVGSIAFAPAEPKGPPRADTTPQFDAVWYEPHAKEKALECCRRLTSAEIQERGKNPSLHGFGFALGGIHCPCDAVKTRGSLVYRPLRGLHGLSGDDIVRLCDWTNLSPGVPGEGHGCYGLTIRWDEARKAEWGRREAECRMREDADKLKAAELQAARMMEEYAALAECASRYVELCEVFHKRGKIRKKDAKRIMGRAPHPDGAVLARAYARISGEREPVASDPEAAAGGAQAQIARQVKVSGKRRAS